MAVLAPQTVLPPPVRHRRRWAPLIIKIVVLLAILAGLAWLARWGYDQITNPAASLVPTTTVKRGTVRMLVYAQGPLQGSRTEQLIAPHVAGGELAITKLLPPGTLVHPGEVVVAFDTSQQEYNLEVAENSLAVAGQNVIEAQATAAATEEEARYAIIHAQNNVRIAELNVEQNPILAKIDAETNVLALGTAQATLAQLEHNFASQQSTDQATIAIQKAAVDAARVQAQIAQRNIAAMTLRAKQGGYMQVMQNTTQRMFFQGMSLPDWQVGDTPRPGMVIAEIPDTQHWQVNATINDLDMGHLQPGQPAKIQFVSLPGQVFPGQVLFLGGMSGPPWDRHVQGAMALDKNSPELRAGMTANVVVTTAILHNALWVPAQAVFHVSGGGGFAAAAPAPFGRRPGRAASRAGSRVGAGAFAGRFPQAGGSPGQLRVQRPAAAGFAGAAAAGGFKRMPARGGFPGHPAGGGPYRGFHPGARPGMPAGMSAAHAAGSDYVYLKVGNGFVRHSVTVLRQSESQVVLTGLKAGDVIALANPEQNTSQSNTKKKPASAMQAISGARGGRP
ncbi:MAG: HlyD family secretion protein [Terriglobales bacterium]